MRFVSDLGPSPQKYGQPRAPDRRSDAERRPAVGVGAGQRPAQHGCGTDPAPGPRPANHGRGGAPPELVASEGGAPVASGALIGGLLDPPSPSPARTRAGVTASGTRTSTVAGRRPTSTQSTKTRAKLSAKSRSMPTPRCSPTTKATYTTTGGGRRRFARHRRRIGFRTALRPRACANSAGTRQIKNRVVTLWKLARSGL